jgi:prophage regulatory protein
MQNWVSDRDIGQSRGQTRTQPWRLAKQGLLPPPIRLSAGCTRWPADEIAAIDQARIAGADDDAVRKLVIDLVAARANGAGKAAA